MWRILVSLILVLALASCSDKEPTAEFWSGTEGGKTWVGDSQWKLYDDGTFFHIASDPDEAISLSPYTDDPQEAAMRAWLGAKLAELTDVADLR